mmetsp:Transcript_1428/g.4378  ORF Transcript_1428/g.4378 Transcript_1428/m.4378 type:complete len:241 (+) Transcript_1428:127-849(+)
MPDVARSPPRAVAGLHRSLSWLDSIAAKSSPGISGVVGVDDLLVGGVGIEALLQQALCLVDEAADCGHLRLHGLAIVGRLLRQLVRLAPEKALELVGLRLDADVALLALAGELGHGRVGGHVLGAGRQDAGLHHLDEGLGLDAERSVVVLIHDLLARVALLGGEDAHGAEDGLGLLGVEGGNCQGGGVEVGQAALLGLLGPLGRVAVAREDDAAVLLEELRDGITVAFAALDERGELRHA